MLHCSPKNSPLFFSFRACVVAAVLLTIGWAVLGDTFYAFAQQGGQAAAPVAGQTEVFGPAPTPGSGQPSFLGSLMELLPVLVVCYFIFYFMVVKPQDSSAKAHKTLIESLKKGDEVITSGGMIGRVAGTEQGFVTLEIASGVKVKFDPTAVKKRLGDEQKSPKAA